MEIIRVFDRKGRREDHLEVDPATRPICHPTTSESSTVLETPARLPVCPRALRIEPPLCQSRLASPVELILKDETSEVSYLDFKEWKNGAGQASLLYVVPELEAHIVAIADHDHWNGYLLPSTQSKEVHVNIYVIRNRFDASAETAEVTEDIDGQKPTPYMGYYPGTLLTYCHSRLPQKALKQSPLNRVVET